MSNRAICALIVVASTRVAAADPVAAAEPAKPAPGSPWGSSPFVVDYVPPQETPSTPPHHGITFEAAVGAGSSTIESNTPALSLALGGWATPRLALALRVSSVGLLQFVGGSAQVVATRDLWIGAGAGSLSELPMNSSRGERTDGVGGFGRIGYQVAGNRHVLYVTAEVQVGSIEGSQRALGLVAFGYQLL